MQPIMTNTSSTAAIAESGRKNTGSDVIAFAIGETELGLVLVARSAIGVCAILIGAEAAEMESDLASRFPESRLSRSDAALGDDLRKVARFIEAPRNGLDLPLDIRGTPFQRRVWDALRAVRVGDTVTYAALARRIGEPNAARAVARACADNPLALAIPCHRVVRSDGALAGYRWGVERKRALIDKEAA